MSLGRRDNLSEEEIEFNKLMSIYDIKELSDEFDNISDEKNDTRNLDRWFYRYIKEMKSQTKIEKVRYFRYAATFTIFLMGIALIGLNTEAIRIDLLNRVLKEEVRYSELSVGNSKAIMSEELVGWTHYYYPEYIPYEYFLVSAEELGSLKRLVFTQGEKKLKFIQRTSSVKIQVDTEDSEVKNISVDGVSIDVIIKGESTTLVWMNGQLSMYLEGEMTEKELLNIFESLVYYK